MRIFALGTVVAALGCATTVQPFAPSTAQQARFDEVVRAAEAAGIDGPGQAASLLGEAKSDWVYAQHLPKYPERARRVAARAMREAEAALLMAHRTQVAVAAPPVRVVRSRPPAPPIGSTKVAAAERPAQLPATLPASPPVEAPAEWPASSPATSAASLPATSAARSPER